MKANQNLLLLILHCILIFQRYVFLKSESKSKLTGYIHDELIGYFKDTFFLKVKANQNSYDGISPEKMILQRYVFLKSESKSKQDVRKFETATGYFKDTFFLKVKANQNRLPQ